MGNLSPEGSMTQYQTLYRKYRSQTFSDLVGQEAASRALQGAIAADRVAHAYLFSGTRGTGKTTTARLLAKAVNCSRRQPGSAEPCNQCESCLQVAAGAALDLIEIDAASNRGIDEIRDLREKVNLAPALGRRKVYIIDEAHMLTGDAFNALLKTLEEPPEHVVFVLCTTEASKIPLTVLGRCQQFVFRRFSAEQVEGRLSWIAEREGIGLEPGVLGLVAQVAEGSMRDAVGLLDQLVPLSEGRISLAQARELLGIADPALMDELFELVLGGRAAGALASLSRIYEGGGELRQVVRGLMERCRDRLVAAIERRDAGLRARLSAALDALLHLDGEVRRHAEPRFLVEATLVRIAVEAGADGGDDESDNFSPPRREGREGPSTRELPLPQPAPLPAPQPVAAGDLSEAWQQRVLSQLPPKIKGLFREARPEHDGSTLALWFRYGFHHQNAQEHVAEVQPLVTAWLGDGVTLEFKLAEPGAPVAATARPPAPEEHPFVQAAVRKLEGKVTRVRETSR
jgi:DNA polymerase III subunit gamma/tau